MKKSVLGIVAALSLAAVLAGCKSPPPPPPPQTQAVPAAAVPAPTPAPAPAAVDQLDLSIRETSDYLNKQLPTGNKLVILNIQSEYPALSEYIIDELIANTVNDRVFTVVDRQQLNAIRAELDFQMSGEVDDNTAQELGRMAGAQIIISGAVSRIGDLYRLRVRALNVQSAQIAAQFNRNIPNNATVTALVNSKATGYGSTGSAPTRAALPPAATASAAQTPAASTAQTAPPPAAPVEPPKPVVYKVGDTGPAGGIVFYDKGNNEGGWRYLEAAPASTEGKDIQWASNEGNVQGTRVEIGSGKKNTQLIMEASIQTGENMAAARLCDRLRVGGYNDWFLPSKAELGLMYLNLKTEGIGGFSNDWYWSSSESPNSWGSYTWTQSFSNGTQTGVDWPVSGGGERAGGKKKAHSVRACRQF